MKEITYISNSYQTTPEKLSLTAKYFPSLYFYSKFVHIVCQASSKSKKGMYSNSDWCDSCFDILKTLEKIGVSVNINGINHLKQLNTPCVIISNHMSILETVILPIIIQPVKDVTYIVKQSLMDYPVFKHVMRNRNPIAVSRTNAREDLKAVLHSGVDRLNKGISVIVFPQTTRTHQFDAEKFNSIGIKLALKAKVPVLPLALKTDAWGNGKILKDFGRIDRSKPVHFAFGEPMELHKRGSSEHQAVIQFISDKLNKW